MTKDDVYIYIMAGGVGSRFQPVSTPDMPKQFLKIVDGKSLIEQTLDRVSKLASNIIIGTNKKYLGIFEKELPKVKLSNIIAEAVSKNTAPSILLASKILYEKNRSSVIICLPSDHYIKEEEKFLNILKFSANLVSNKKIIVTLGMKPTYPSTEFGYINANLLLMKEKNNSDIEVKIVNSFTEKPDIETAKRFLKSNDYYWNSGVFVFRTDFMLELFKRHRPEMFKLVKPIHNLEDYKLIDDYFKKVDKISVDYAIMERIRDVVVIPTEIGWNDIGSWSSLERFIKENKKVNISGDFLSYLGKISKD